MQSATQSVTPAPVDDSARLAALGLRVTPSMTQPTRPGKKPRPVWEVRGAVDGYEATFRALDGKKWRGAWSFWTDPTEMILRHAGERMTVAERVEYQAERKLAKSQRYASYAEHAASRARAAYDRVTAITQFIPLGQPILVGHHSERRARADQRRIHRGMDKFCQEHRKGEYLAGQSRALERDATAPKSLRFIGNRIDDARSDIARIKAWIEGRYYVRGPVTFTPTAEYLAQKEMEMRRALETLAYWEGERAKHGETSTLPGPDTIRKGFFIDCWAGGREVVKVNRLSVTIKDWWSEEGRRSGRFHTRTVKYKDIRKFFEPSAEQLARYRAGEAPASVPIRQESNE